MPLHGWSPYTDIMCKKCGAATRFTGGDGSDVEAWKDKHYKDGKLVCVAAYPEHIRGKLGPILERGQAGEPRPRFGNYIVADLNSPGGMVPTIEGTPMQVTLTQPQFPVMTIRTVAARQQGLSVSAAALERVMRHMIIDEVDEWPGETIRYPDGSMEQRNAAGEVVATQDRAGIIHGNPWRWVSPHAPQPPRPLDERASPDFMRFMEGLTRDMVGDEHTEAMRARIRDDLRGYTDPSLGTPHEENPT